MTRDERALIYRSLDGDPGATDARRLEGLLAASAEARDELARARRLRVLVREGALARAEGAGKPFLAERVLRRLAPAEAERFAFDLMWLFRRVAFGGMLVVAGLAAYNAATHAAYLDGHTALEAVLALPPETLDTAYDLALDTP